jgi:hypothetical protein
VSRLVLALAAALALLAAPAADAAKRKPPARKAKVVCFKKAGKNVCRKRRPAAKKPAFAARPGGQSPAPAAGTVPTQPPGDSPLTSAGTVPSHVPGDSPHTTPAVVEPAVPDCGTSPWVGYTAQDIDGVFRLTGKRECVAGPTVIFQLRNVDAQEHNLYAEGVSPAAPRRAIIATVEPGQTLDAQTTLAAGQWRLFCEIEGHESMSRTLTVTG